MHQPRRKQWQWSCFVTTVASDNCFNCVETWWHTSEIYGKVLVGNPPALVKTTAKSQYARMSGKHELVDVHASVPLMINELLDVVPRTDLDMWQYVPTGRKESPTRNTAVGQVCMRSKLEWKLWLYLAIPTRTCLTCICFW
jgi:hypothetical protein